MLWDVAAILSSSSTLGSVAGAFAVSENLSTQVSVVAQATPNVQQAAWGSALDASAAGAPVVTGPQQAAAVTTKVSASRLASLRGAELLDQLALLTPSTLAGFVESHPSSISALLANQPAAGRVADSWAGWTAAQRTDMIRSAPRLIGNLEGVPYSARDTANRISLTASETALRTKIAATSTGRAAKDQLTKQLHMLEQVRAALATGESGNRRSLVSLDASGQGRAVIEIGDASTADYVDYLIPGMFSDVDTQIQVLAGGADNIATQQRAWLKKLNPGVPASQLPTVATFAWIGYQTPNIVNVTSMNLARQGQAALTGSIAGLRAERSAQVDGTQPYVAVLAHSYGSTAAMLALQDDDVSIDALAIVGSPGSPATTANQLKVTDGNVWVGAGDTDPVPQTGLFGSQPTSAAYGAHRFGVAGAVDPMTGKKMGAVVGHDGYFVDGTESLRNMVLIGIGRGDLVLGLDGQSALASGKAKATIPRGPAL